MLTSERYSWLIPPFCVEMIAVQLVYQKTKSRETLKDIEKMYNMLRWGGLKDNVYGQLKH